MGSLVSGWSSSVLSDKEVRLMRNRSLTKDEVAAFWRQQQQQHVRPATDAIAAGSPRAEILVPLAAASKRQLEATRSLPPLPGRGRAGGGTGSNDDDLTCYSAYGHGAGDQQQQLVSSRSAATARGREGFFFLPDPDGSGTSRGWWTRSSSAFLNEPLPPPPPGEEVLLGRAQSDPQFHAARIVTGNA